MPNENNDLSWNGFLQQVITSGRQNGNFDNNIFIFKDLIFFMIKFYVIWRWSNDFGWCGWKYLTMKKQLNGFEVYLEVIFIKLQN